MHRCRRLFAALAVLFLLSSCSNDRPAHVSTQLASTNAPAFTPEQVRYLEVQAWRAAETSAFLHAVAAIRAAVPDELREIMWCEAGSYIGLPFPQTNYAAKTHGHEGASGGGQALGSTWRTWAREIGVDVTTWPVAYMAPDWVQDLVLTHGYETRGTSPWTESAGCWS